MKRAVSLHLGVTITLIVSTVICVVNTLSINHAADSRQCTLNHRQRIPIYLWNMVDVKPVLLEEQQLKWMDSVNISTSELQQAAAMIPRY